MLPVINRSVREARAQLQKGRVQKEVLVHDAVGGCEKGKEVLEKVCLVKR